MIPEVPGLLSTIDQNLVPATQQMGTWIYLFLFCVILIETAVIVVILPGNSLLFVSGAAAATGLLIFPWLLIVFILAAFTGYLLSYHLGRYLGLNIFKKRFPGLFKDEYIDKTNRYFENYGGVTIIVAPFVPIIRKFAPFIAGIGHMDYNRFLIFDLTGAMCWAGTGLLFGYLLGGVPWIKELIPLVLAIVIVITIISIILTIIFLVRGRKISHPGNKADLRRSR
jgi:membrane-associated protein